MGLFDQILGALNDPNQQGNPDELSSMLNQVQRTAGSNGMDPQSTQTAMSMLGGFVRSALQEKQSTGGRGQAEAIVNQFGGLNPSTAALSALFSSGQQQQIAQSISQRTGIPAGTIVALLPMLVPIVLNFLKTGASNPSVPSANANASNPVLNTFLDSDGDGDVDIGDAMAMAGRFMQR